MNRLRIRTLADRAGGYGQWQPLVQGTSQGPCTTRDCTTTYTGPSGVECCCFYDCPSGGTWVCRRGEYCAA